MTGIQSTLEVMPDYENGPVPAEIPYEFNNAMQEA